MVPRPGMAPDAAPELFAINDLREKCRAGVSDCGDTLMGQEDSG